MKTLILLRHAKSSWSDPGLTDHDRPLNKRGKHDAPRVGRWIAAEQLVPELIVSSTAKRARKTAAKVAKHCDYDGNVRLVSELYLAPAQTYIEVLQRLGDGFDPIMAVGHNPGMAHLLTMLTGHNDPFPTAALARIELPIEAWSQLSPQTQGRLVALWRPRELED